MWSLLQIKYKYIHTLLIIAELEKFYVWHKMLSTIELHRKELRLQHQLQFSLNLVYFLLYSRINGYKFTVRKQHHIFNKLSKKCK
jgi:hypothetical protein